MLHRLRSYGVPVPVDCRSIEVSGDPWGGGATESETMRRTSPASQTIRPFDGVPIDIVCADPVSRDRQSLLDALRTNN